MARGAVEHRGGNGRRVRRSDNALADSALHPEPPPCADRAILHAGLDGHRDVRGWAHRQLRTLRTAVLHRAIEAGHDAHQGHPRRVSQPHQARSLGSSASGGDSMSSEANLTEPDPRRSRRLRWLAGIAAVAGLAAAIALPVGTLVTCDQLGYRTTECAIDHCGMRALLAFVGLLTSWLLLREARRTDRGVAGTNHPLATPLACLAVAAVELAVLWMVFFRGYVGFCGTPSPGETSARCGPSAYPGGFRVWGPALPLAVLVGAAAALLRHRHRILDSLVVAALALLCVASFAGAYWVRGVAGLDASGCQPGIPCDPIPVFPNQQLAVVMGAVGAVAGVLAVAKLLSSMSHVRRAPARADEPAR
jgi:hypothetical protein